MNYILIKIVMENMLYCLVVTFLVSVIKYLTRSNLRKAHFGSQFKETQSITVGEIWWQEYEATGHTAPAVSKLSEVNAAAQVLCGMLLLTIRVDGHCLGKPFWNTLLDTPRVVFPW